MNIQTAPFVGTVNVARKLSSDGDIWSIEYNNKVFNDLLMYLRAIGHESYMVLVQLIEYTAEEAFPDLTMANGLKPCFSRRVYLSAMKFPAVKDVRVFENVVEWNKIVMERIFVTPMFLWIPQT